MIQFVKATRKALKGRIAIDGPSGSGKTFTALRMGFTIAQGGRVVVIASESGAVEKYAGEKPDGTPWEFDVCFLSDFSPATYAEAILAAGKAGYAVIIIDSLSHAWNGEGGALELVDRKGGNSFTAWKDITPMHNRMIESIVRSPAHVIATMRSKTEYVLEPGANGKTVPRKIGTAPVQRAGMEYEFDLYCSLDWSHICTVSKSRCPELDNAIAVKPGADFIRPFIAWLAEGSNVPEGYYTADADDLKALAKAEEAAKPAEQKRAEAAAGQQAALRAQLAGSGSVQPVAAQQQTAAANPVTDLVTEEVKASIIALFKSSGQPKEKFAELLFKYGKKAVGELTQLEAATVKGELLRLQPGAMADARAEAVEKPVAVEAKPVAETAPSPQAASAASPVVQQQPAPPQQQPPATVESTGPKIDPINLAAITKLVKETPRNVLPMHEVKAFLQARGKNTFAEISNADAVKLIGEINGRVEAAKKAGTAAGSPSAA